MADEKKATEQTESVRETPVPEAKSENSLNAERRVVNVTNSLGNDTFSHVASRTFVEQPDGTLKRVMEMTPEEHGDFLNTQRKELPAPALNDRPGDLEIPDHAILTPFKRKAI